MLSLFGVIGKHVYTLLILPAYPLEGFYFVLGHLILMFLAFQETWIYLVICSISEKCQFLFYKIQEYYKLRKNRPAFATKNCYILWQ